MTDAERIYEALACAQLFGSIDGAHHKMWVIDQMVRYLTADQPSHSNYDMFVAKYRAGEDGPETYDWDVGIAP